MTVKTGWRLGWTLLCLNVSAIALNVFRVTHGRPGQRSQYLLLILVNAVAVFSAGRSLSQLAVLREPRSRG